MATSAQACSHALATGKLFRVQGSCIKVLKGGACGPNGAQMLNIHLSQNIFRTQASTYPFNIISYPFNMDTFYDNNEASESAYLPPLWQHSNIS